MSGVATGEPELEPPQATIQAEEEQPAQPTANPTAPAAPGPPAPAALDAAAIAQAFAGLVPGLLAPLTLQIQQLQSDNAALRTEVASVRSERAAAAVEEPAAPVKFYVPDYGAANAHHGKPHTVTNEPQLFDLRGDKTYDSLHAPRGKDGKPSKGAHYFEFCTLACACYYLLNTVLHLQSVLPRILKRVEASATITTDGVAVSGADDADHLHCIYNSVKGVYDNLLNTRLQFLQLRCMLAPDGQAVPAEKRGLLEVFTNKVYGAMREALPTNLDATFRTCINDWEKSTQTAQVKQAANATARARSGAAPAASGSTGSLGEARKQPKARRPKGKGAGR